MNIHNIQPQNTVYRIYTASSDIPGHCVMIVLFRGTTPILGIIILKICDGIGKVKVLSESRASLNQLTTLTRISWSEETHGIDVAS